MATKMVDMMVRMKVLLLVETMVLWKAVLLVDAMEWRLVASMGKKLD